MELRKAADVFLRSQTNPLSSLLNPSSTPRWAASAQLCYRTAINKCTQRALTTSTRNNALKPQPTTSAPTKDSATTSNELSELSNSLWASPRTKSSPRLSLEEEKRMNNGDSASDILKAITEASGPKRSTGINISDMLNPSAPLNDTRNLMGDMLKGPMATPPTRRIPMRLTPSTGRSITIGTGIDVARGLRLLEQSCARNRVRADFTAQRFHERGGLKRKRLRRQRWRKRFMEGFRATVGRVKQLKHQGW